jgi:uncharacterized protein (TIGR03437 family)
VYFVSPTQLNVLAPEFAVRESVPVQVITRNGESNIVQAPATPLSPALFTYGQPVNRYLAAVRPDGSYIAPRDAFPGAATSPARPGDIIIFFGIGFGPTTPAAIVGQMSEVSPLATPPKVTVGGVEAQTTFAGLVGPGLYQFNIVVPNLSDGEHEISAVVSGTSSQTGVFVPVERP